MQCYYCKENAVFNYEKSYCKRHFIEYFENKVKKTIKRFKLIKKKDRVCVAVSGGKDSSSLLFILNKLGYKVEGLAIDEGIKNYRDKTLLDLKRISKKYNIKVKIVSFKKNFGSTLDNIIKKEHRACSVCGVLRRRLLNLYSKDYNVIATGHNLDDEAQAILMNLFKGNLALLRRLGPVSGEKKILNFTKRVKPFYFCSEKEILAYSFLNGLNIGYNECPHVYNSFRAKVRDYLNYLENNKKGIKINIVNWFLNLKFDKNTEKIKTCKICNEPSSDEICNVCKYLEKIKIKNKE